MTPLAVIIPLIVAAGLGLLLYVLKHADCTADPDDWDWEELVCVCPDPTPELVWGASQCSTCLRKIDEQ